MKHNTFLLMIFFLLSLAGAPVAQGENPPSGRVEPPLPPPEAGAGDLLNLDLHVYIAAKPIYCILVEKDRQRLRVLRHDGRLQVVAEYAAATGENPGPKENEGDSKTPEGVYFITKAYLDRKVSVFGTRAFHLNYPNYFDLREGRSGYGIYIHGTNRELRFNSSNGCVTLNNTDLDRLADYLTVGTPVFIVPSLGTLTEGKGGYPNLAEHNFDGAKALLVPDAAAQTDFASLYLIRINGQTVVAGEYWSEQGTVKAPLKSDRDSVPPQLTVAYLQGAAGNHWSVVDRGPAENGPREGDAVTISGLPMELGRQQTNRMADAAAWSIVAPLPWQLSPEDLYLSWYQESNQSGMLSPVLGQESFSPAVVSVTNGSSGGRDGKVYGIFFVATCISIGSALLLIRRQIRRQGDDSLLGTGFEEGALGLGGRGVVQVTLLRDEVKQAVGALHTVQKRIDEEAMNVESLEELQARMSALEWTFQDKQSEIDRLSAEQAALKSQGMAEHSGQAEALSLLQRELIEVKERLDEARQAMGGVVDREGMVHDQLAELRRLAEREMASKNGEEIQEVVAACDSLRGQVQAMAEALRGREMSRQQELGGAGRGSAEVAAALQAYAAELKGLHVEMAEIKGVADTSGIEAVLQGLRDELREEQTTKLELMTQLGRMRLVEEELASRNLENQALQKESEERRLQAVVEKMALETALEALRQELSAEQVAKSELASRLVCFGDLEEKLAGLNRENEAMRKRREEWRAGAEAEKVVLQSSLDSLRLELSEAQAEKSDLTGRLVRITELDEELAVRGQEIYALRQEGEERYAQAVAEKIELETALAALRHDLSEAETAKADLTNRLGRVADLEMELTGREQAIKALRREGEAHQAQAVAEKMELESALVALRHELSEAEGAKSDLANRLVRIAELEEDLASRGQEIDRLRELSEERIQAAAAEKSRLDLELDSLQNELRQEQMSKLDLMSRLGRISELEEELASRNREVDALQDDSEERQAEVAMEKSRLESALESVRGELQEERSLRAELTNRLGRIGELEEELVVRSREVEALRQANEAAVVDQGSEKSRLEASLAEIVLARQIEVTSLTSALQEAKVKALAEQEAVQALTHQVETLKESLRQVSEEQAREQDGAVEDLRQEVMTLKAMVAELEKKASVAEGVVLVKGSHYLPGDVLRKWIGKEE